MATAGESDVDVTPLVTKSFYGRASKLYLNPLERRNLSPVCEREARQDAKQPVHEAAKKSAVKRKNSTTKTVQKSTKLSIDKSECKSVTDEQPMSPIKTPKKRKFFKHRQDSPSKRKRSKNGISVQLHKGVSMKFTPGSSDKKETPDQKRLVLKPRNSCITSKVSDSPEEDATVNSQSQDLFPDYSQNAVLDSGCSSGELQTTADNQDSCQDNWSNCSTMSDSINVISSVSSPISDAPSSPVSGLSEKSTTQPSSPKLFPIFAPQCATPEMTKTRSQSRASPSPSTAQRSRQRSPRHILKKMKDKDGKEQMILDFGQRLAGAVKCDSCGMTFSSGEPSDEAMHAKFHHRMLTTLKFKGWKSERVVQTFPDGSRIIVVLPDDKMAAKKVAMIRSIVDNDLGFVVDSSQNMHNTKTYLYISSEQRVVGCCVTAVITQGYRVVGGTVSSPKKRGPGAAPLCCSTEAEPARCGISRIWVLTSHRRQGIATKLLDAIRMHFVMGCPLRRDDLAFTDPTPDGRVFAAHYMDTPSFLVYKHSTDRTTRPNTTLSDQ